MLVNQVARTMWAQLVLLGPRINLSAWKMQQAPIDTALEVRCVLLSRAWWGRAQYESEKDSHKLMGQECDQIQKCDMCLMGLASTSFYLTAK